MNGPIKKGYAIARHIFGEEPSNPEIYDFVLKNYLQLKFGAPQEFKLEIKRMNPKRLQRVVRREMEKVRETTKPSTHAQDYMREELEKHKKEKKSLSKKEKEARQEKQFLLKQEKKRNIVVIKIEKPRDLRLSKNSITLLSKALR